MDQRIGMDALDRDGGGQRGLFCAFTKLSRGEHEHGTQAFAASLEAVAHGGVQAGGTRVRRRQKGFNPAFDEGDPALELGGKIHGGSFAVGGARRNTRAAAMRGRASYFLRAKLFSPSRAAVTINRAVSSMPTYEYACQKCGHQFEQFQSMREEPLKKCPKCGKTSLKRLLGTGAGLIFKGSGFYITDYKKKSGGKESGGEGKSGSASEAKPASNSGSSAAAKSGGDKGASNSGGASSTSPKST